MIISSYICFLVCEELSNDGVRVTRSTIFQDIRPGAGFETGDSAKEKVGRLSKTTFLGLFVWRAFCFSETLTTDPCYYSTPRNQRIFLTNVSWLLNTRKDTILKKYIYFLQGKGLSIDDVGVSRVTIFQEIPTGAGFETADFV